MAATTATSPTRASSTRSTSRSTSTATCSSRRRSPTHAPVGRPGAAAGRARRAGPHARHLHAGGDRPTTRSQRRTTGCACAARATDYEITGLPLPGPLFRLADFDRPGFSVLTDSTEIPSHDESAAAARAPSPPAAHAQGDALLRRRARPAPRRCATSNRHGLPFESYELAFTPAAAHRRLRRARDGRRDDRGPLRPPRRRRLVGAVGTLAVPRRARPRPTRARASSRASRTSIRSAAATTIGYLGDYFLLSRRGRGRRRQPHARRPSSTCARCAAAARSIPTTTSPRCCSTSSAGSRPRRCAARAPRADDLGGLTSQATPADDAAIARAVRRAVVCRAGRGRGRRCSTVPPSRQVLRPRALPRIRRGAAAGRAPRSCASSTRVAGLAASRSASSTPNGSGKVELTKVQAEPGPATSATIAAGRHRDARRRSTRLRSPRRGCAGWAPGARS